MAKVAFKRNDPATWPPVNEPVLLFFMFMGNWVAVVGHHTQKNTPDPIMIAWAKTEKFVNLFRGIWWFGAGSENSPPVDDPNWNIARGLGGEWTESDPLYWEGISLPENLTNKCRSMTSEEAEQQRCVNSADQRSNPSNQLRGGAI